jgi:hypothetical protein
MSEVTLLPMLILDLSNLQQKKALDLSKQANVSQNRNLIVYKQQ